MRYIAYVDNQKNIAITRALGNEDFVACLRRIALSLGYEPLHYDIIASSEDEVKLVINYTFGENMFFISAFSNPI
jgi:hypothetical protein